MGRETTPASQDTTAAAATEGILTTGEKTHHGRVSTPLSFKDKDRYCGFITDPLTPIIGGSAHCLS